MSTLLFDIPGQEKKKESNYRCRTCDHIFSHKYNKSFKYCEKRKSNKTSNGYLKIKANDFGCKMHTKNINQ